MILAALILLNHMIVFVSGHAYLSDPPSRGYAWKAGFETPRFEKYDKLNCGAKSGPAKDIKCGLCGDSYDLKPPRPMEMCGTHGKAVIVERYNINEVIKVKVMVKDHNHKGYFVFEVCDQNNPLEPATESCFKKWILHRSDGTGPLFTVSSHTAREYVFELRLPEKLKCWLCVFRWKFLKIVSGDSPTVTYINCADVAIGNYPRPEAVTTPKVVTQPSKIGSKGTWKTRKPGPNKGWYCRPIYIQKIVPGMIWWCKRMGWYYPTYCCCGRACKKHYS